MSAERYLIERCDPASRYREWRVSRWTHTDDIRKAPRFTREEAERICDYMNAIGETVEAIWRERDVMDGKAGDPVLAIRKGEHA